MTPSARVSAAIEILDLILAGGASEQILTRWARSNRYAGSGDRAAIRDHVFDALRCRRSCAWRGRAETGRGLMIGACRAAGLDPDTTFTGERFAPAPLTEEERTAAPIEAAPEAVRLDCPDWLWPELSASLGDQTAAVLTALQSRAPVFLRVNLRKTTVPKVVEELAAADIITRPHPLSPAALEVTGNPRRVQASPAYLDGRIELQDAASQAVMQFIPLRNGMKVLDYCAGGGGKSLALAARADIQITAHDASPARMRDLPERASRAGVEITLAEDKTLLEPADHDLVLCDVPCSGSGAWRRSPEAKWTLTPGRLGELRAVQAQILDDAVALVAPSGLLAYATCSLLASENHTQIAQFLSRHPGWSMVADRRLTPLEGGDGFYIALLTRG